MKGFVRRKDDEKPVEAKPAQRCDRACRRQEHQKQELEVGKLSKV